MNPEELLVLLNDDPLLTGQVASVINVEARKGAFAEIPEHFHYRIRDRLTTQKITRLYSHQAKAIELLKQQKNVVLVTGTNSGKTLAYALPALDVACREPAARCLMLFPTKALAQDQVRRLTALSPGGDVRIGAYDGDTPQAQRATLRRLAHVLLTNPDMLHLGILPNHESWVPFLKNLKYIVIDEMHAYRGIFGSHVALILRRLLRLCEWHGASPQIVACSATIGNPLSLFSSLTGRTAEIVEEDGSPQAKRTYLFWNPPLIDDETRVSANHSTAKMIAALADSGLRTLAFCRSRVGVEIVLNMARDLLRSESRFPNASPESIESYRAGYTPKERRQIEKDLFTGRLKALVATNAMEMGVDIGDLDVVIMNGYPGSVASFRQQAGRAGRGEREGLAVMIAGDDPLEQFFVREPEMLLEASGESVGINPNNRTILASHLRCAAYERPFRPSELERFPSNSLDTAESLDAAGELSLSQGVFYYPSFDPPAPKVAIRGGEGQVLLSVEGQELGTMERWRALQYAHEGAIYLHRGHQYLVDELDLDANTAHLRPSNMPYYTQPMVSSLIETLTQVASQPLGLDRLSLVGVRVTETVDAFRRRSLDGRVLGVELLELPPQVFSTVAVRLDVDVDYEETDAMGFASALHGLEHALIALAPYYAGCDPGDLGSAFYGVSPDSLKPSLYVFDRAEGGMGLSEALFNIKSEWVRASHRLLSSCSCERGCPACLWSPRCSLNNEALDKKRAAELLLRLVD